MSKLEKIEVDPLVGKFQEIEKERQSGSGIKLSKNLLDSLDYIQNQSDDRFSEENRAAYLHDPNRNMEYRGLFRTRETLLPYYIIKELFNTDDLLATILSNQSAKNSMFGIPQTDRHEVGFRIVFREPDIDKKLPKSKLDDLKLRMLKVKSFYYNCGVADSNQSTKVNLPSLIKEIIRDGLRYGFSSLEKIRNLKGDLIGFRTVDSGHIYLAPNPTDQNRAVRQAAYTKLMSGNDLKEVKNAHALAEVASGNKSYKWIQVINDVPKTAFTESQLLVHNFFPVPDIDTNGYPRPPIESIVKAVSSHINIASQNHLYFANGRAAKGMLVIKSEQLTEPVMQRLRQQFYASINSVSNSHRSPFFQIGLGDSIEWVNMEGGKDGEFQYLDEKTMRVILAAFGMAPEEIPALSNIGRSTPTQALAETANEYKMSVGRFASQYNLLYTVQVMLNELLEEIDPEVAKYCVFKFVGLQSDDQQKELIRAQQAANLYLNGNELRRMFEADQLPMGGNIPLNPAIMNVISNNFYMNQWLYQFTGDKSVLTDMTLGFISNGNWFNYIQGVGREIFLSKERIGKAMGDYLKEIKEIMEEEKNKDDNI